MPLTRSLNGINTYEGFKTAYGNTALYNALGGDAGFSDAIASNNENTLNTFISAVMSADELGGIDAFKANYNTDYLTNSQRLNAVANELWQDRNEVKWYDQYKKDADGNYILNDDGSYQTENVKGTTYDYVKEQLKNQADNNKRIADTEALQLQKDAMNGWAKFGLAISSTIMNLTATVLDTFKDGVMFVGKLIESTWNPGALRYYMSNQSGYGAGMFSDWMADFDTQYTILRDAYGNNTTIGSMLYGISNTFGEMIPTMLMQYAGAGISKLVTAGVTKTMTKAGQTAAKIATTTGKIAKGTKTASTIIGTTYWYNLGVSNIKDYVASSPNASMWQLCLTGFAVAAVQASVTYVMSKTIGSSLMDKVTLGSEFAGSDAIVKAISKSGAVEGLKKYAIAFIKDGYRQAIEEEFQELGQYLVEQVSVQLNSKYNALFEVSSEQFFNAAAMAFVTSFISVSFNYLGQSLTRLDNVGDPIIDTNELQKLGGVNALNSDNFKQVFKYNNKGEIKYHKLSVQQSIDIKNLMSTITSEAKELEVLMTLFDDPRYTELLEKYTNQVKKLGDIERQIKEAHEEYIKAREARQEAMIGQQQAIKDMAQYGFWDVTQFERQKVPEGAKPVSPTKISGKFNLHEHGINNRNRSVYGAEDYRDRLNNAGLKLTEAERIENAAASKYGRLVQDRRTLKNTINKSYNRLNETNTALTNEYINDLKERQRRQIHMRLNTLVNASEVLAQFYGQMGDESFKNSIKYLNKLNDGRESQLRIRNAGGYVKYMNKQIGNIQSRYAHKSWLKLLKHMQENGFNDAIAMKAADVKADNIVNVVDKTLENKSKATKELQNAVEKKQNAEDNKAIAIGNEADEEVAKTMEQRRKQQEALNKSPNAIWFNKNTTGTTTTPANELDPYNEYKANSKQKNAEIEAERKQKMELAKKIYDIYTVVEQPEGGELTDLIVAEDAKTVIFEELNAENAKDSRMVALEEEGEITDNKKRRVIVLPITVVLDNDTAKIIKIAAERRIIYDMLDSPIIQKLLEKFRHIYELVYGVPQYHLQTEENMLYSDYFDETHSDETILTNLLFNKQFVGLCLYVANDEMMQLIATLPTMFEAYAKKAASGEDGYELAQITKKAIESIKDNINSTVLDYYIYSDTTNGLDLAEIKQFDVFNEKYFTKEKQEDFKNKYKENTIGRTVIQSNGTEYTKTPTWSDEYKTNTTAYYRWLVRGTRIYINPDRQLVVAGTQLLPGTEAYEHQYVVQTQIKLRALQESNARAKPGYVTDPSFIGTQFETWCESNNLIPVNVQNFYMTKKLSDLHADDALLEKIAQYCNCTVDDLVDTMVADWIENNLFNYSGIALTYDGDTNAIILEGTQKEDLRFANTGTGRALSESLVIRPDLMQDLYSEFQNDVLREDNGKNNQTNFIKWMKENHPELNELTKAISKLTGQGFEVSFAPTNNAQKYVGYYIDGDVSPDVFAYSTINDLIYNPSLLNEETKSAIIARYGSLTPTTTFYYLKRDIFLKTAETNNPVTIAELGNNRFAFVSMSKTADMMMPGYRDQYNTYTKASTTEKPIVKKGKTKAAFNERYNMDVNLIPELNYLDDDGNPVYIVPSQDVHEQKYANKKGYTVVRIDAFIPDNLLTSSELRDMQLIIEHGKNGSSSTRVTDRNGISGYGYYNPTTNTIHIPDIVPVDTILHEFIHGLERANMTSNGERFDIVPANIFSHYDIAVKDGGTYKAGEDNDIVAFALDILRHSCNGLAVWKQLTGDTNATFENFEGAVDVNLAKAVVATYLYSASSQELMVRGNSYAVVDALPPNIVKHTTSSPVNGLVSTFTVYTPWNTQISFLEKNSENTVNSFSLSQSGEDTCVDINNQFEVAFDTLYKDSILYDDINTDTVNVSDSINARDTMLARCDNTLDEVHQMYTERQQEAFRVLSHTYTDLTNTHYKDINNHFFDTVAQDTRLRNTSLTKLYYKLGYNTKGTMQDFLNADIPVIVFNKATNKYSGIFIASNINEAIATICSNYSRRNIVDDIKNLGIATVKPKDIVFVTDNNNAVTTSSAVTNANYYAVDHFTNIDKSYAKSDAAIKIVTNEYNGNRNITVHTSLTDGDSYNAAFNNVCDKIVVYDRTYKCKADKVIIDTVNNTLLYTHDLNDSTTYVNTQRLDTSDNIYASYLFHDVEPDTCFDIKTSTITFNDGTIDSHCTLVPYNQVTDEGNILAGNGKTYSIDDIVDIRNDAEPVETTFADSHNSVPNEVQVEDGLDTKLNNKENLGELISANDFYEKFANSDISDQETIISTLKQEVKNLQKLLKENGTKDTCNQLFKLQTRLINTLLYTVRSSMFGSQEFQAFLFNRTDSPIDYFDMVKEYMSNDITRLPYDSPLYTFVNEIIGSKTLTYKGFNGILRTKSADELSVIAEYLYNYYTWSSDTSDGFYAMYALTADAIMNKSIHNFSYNEYANRLLLLDSNNLNRQLHTLDIQSLMTFINTLEDLTDNYPEMQRIYDAAQMAYTDITKAYIVDKTVFNPNYGTHDVINHNNPDNPSLFVIPQAGVINETDTTIPNWTKDEVDILHDLQNCVTRNGNSSTLMHMIIVESIESVYNSVNNADGKKINAWLDIINSSVYNKIAENFNDNIRRKVDIVESTIRNRAANILITYLTTTKIITNIDAIQAELISMAMMSDDKLANAFNNYNFNDDKLWYYLCETKILREKIKGNSAINTDLDLALYNVEQSITNEITNRTNEDEEISFDLADGDILSLIEDDELKENRNIRKALQDETKRKNVAKQGHGIFNRTILKNQRIREIETVDAVSGKSWKAKFNANGKPVYQVAKKKYAGTNIETLQFGHKIKAQQHLQMSPEMQEFIVSTKLEPDAEHPDEYMSPALKDFIIERNTDSSKTVFNYNDLLFFIRSNDFEDINDYTFNQIKKYFFMFDDVNSLQDLKDLSDRVEMFWIVSCILQMPSEQTNIDFADLNNMKLKSVRDIDEYAHIINKNNPKLYDRIYKQIQNINIARGNLRVQILNNYDGTIDSMRRIYCIARWLAINESWLITPGEVPTVSLEENIGGSKDNDSNRKREEVISNKTKEDVETDALSSFINSDEDKIKEIVDYRTREYYANNPEATYNQGTRFAYDLETKLEDGTIDELNEAYAAMMLERDAGVKYDVAEVRAKVAVAHFDAAGDKTVESVRNMIKNRVAWLKDNLTLPEYKELVKTYPELFNEDGTFKDDLYKKKTRSELGSLLNTLNTIRDAAKVNSFKSVKRLKELRAANTLKSKADAKELRELRAENKKLQKRVDGIDANKREYFLSFTLNEDEAVPKGLVTILKTSIESDSTYKSAVQFNDNEDSQTIAMSVSNFTNSNQSTFDKMTNNDKQDIIRYLYNHLGTPDGTKDAVKIYNIVTLWTLAYFKAEVNNGTIKLDAEELKMLDTAYGTRASGFGAGLHAVNEAISEMHLEKHNVDSALQAAGIDYTETQVDTISTILDTPIGKICTDTFFTAHHLDKSKVKKWDDGQVTMTRDLKQALLTSSVQDLTKTALAGVHGRKAYARVMNGILAFEQACLMSWPGTWLRNLTSNAILKELNALGDRLGKGFTSIPGVKGKVEKGKEAIKAKGIRGTHIYEITGTKPTPATKDAVQRFINTPMYTDEKGNVVTLYKSVETGMTRYNDVMFNKSGKRNISSATTLSDMIMDSISINVFNYHRFDSMSDSKAKQQIGKTLNNVANWMFKMLSDDPFIKRTTTYLFERMCTERGIIPSRISINDSDCINIFAEAYTQAAYQYIHRTSFLKKMESTLKSQSFGGEMGWFVLKQFMPFMNATWNWGVEALNYSPYGLVKGITQIFRLEKTFDKNVTRYSDVHGTPSPNFTLYNARQTLGKGIIGTALMGFGAALAALGVIALDDDDDKLKLYVGGNTYIDVSGVFGSSSFLAGAAVIWDIFKADDDMSTGARLWSSFDSCLSYLFEDSLFNDLFNSFRYSTSVGDWLTYNFFNIFGNFIPNVWKQLVSLTYTYEPQYSSGTLGQLQRIATKLLPAQIIPGVDKQYDPYTGEVVYNYRAAWFTKFWNSISPVDIAPYKTSNIEAIALSLGIKKSQLTGDYDDIGKLTNKQKSILNQMYGQLNKQELTKLINGKLSVRVENEDGTYSTLKWNRMTDTQKASAITGIMSKNATYAKIYVFTSAMGGKYYASDSEYAILKSYGIIGNVYRQTGKLNGFVKS